MAYWYRGFAAFVEATASERHAELKERTVISELAIAYLILGGVGAGCIAVCSLLDLVSNASVSEMLIAIKGRRFAPVRV